MPQDIYQTSKVAKVLLLMNRGSGQQYRGKSLQEIDVSPELEDDNVDEPEGMNENNSANSPQNENEPVIAESKSDESEMEISRKRASRNKKAKKTKPGKNIFSNLEGKILFRNVMFNSFIFFS